MLKNEMFRSKLSVKFLRANFVKVTGGVTFNHYLDSEDYFRLRIFMVTNFGHTIEQSTRLIRVNLIGNGKLPISNSGHKDSYRKQRVELLALLYNLGMKITLDEFTIFREDFEELTRNYYLNTEGKIVMFENERSIFQKDTSEGIRKVADVEMKTYFAVEAGEEGEKSLVLTRGLVKEYVALSFSYPQYRREGFYAGRKSSVFSETNDTEKVLIDMGEVFQSLATVLNNLLSAEKLNEETYNGVMDGYESFIFEALDFSEISQMIDKHVGLKDDKKKRISNRKVIKKSN